MKNLNKIIAIVFITAISFSCDDSENEAIPAYLDGTQYGVNLFVDVTAGKTIAIADVNTATVDFAVSFEGDKRPVASIVASKTFTPSGGSATAAISEASFTTFPSSASITVGQLITGVPGLTSTADLAAGDKFDMKFVINYQDGGVVTRYGTLNNPNFSVTFN